MSLKCTPDIAELLPTRQYRCEYGCKEVYGNQSHYQVHLRRRHNVTILKDPEKEQTSYHCPIEKCIYHVEMRGARSFSNLRFLRQHYQKVHMAKENKCDKCLETFLLPRQLEKHHCCVTFECPVCELKYSSKAALQTHMRRKSHMGSINQSINEISTKVALPTLKAWKKSQQAQKAVESISQETIQPLYYTIPAIEMPYFIEVPVEMQPVSVDDVSLEVQPMDEPIPNFTAEEVERLLRDMETQTDDVDLDGIDLNNEELAPLLRNIQTQTLDNRQNQGTMTELDLDATCDFEPMFCEQTSAHMHTQSDFGPIFGEQTSTHMQTQTCNELFEELGLSHIQTQTHWSDGLYNTQQTQTCDEMLDELLENFQSTCTQTRWLDWQETADSVEYQQQH
ncbi:uncharacterized protein LOC108598307 [Drosophila busckii]|uniref:uncharacterized protein LOC108598307 n=1 Tax=Drosophila busckii TaxID=30019 RepID=UPI001432BD0C|nr:uncharacterized protein LOC108598307 [Drosophila busckii]